MSDRDEGVHAIESLFCDALVDEWISVFADGMSEVRSEGKEEADRIDRARRHSYELSARARFLTQLKDLIEGSRRRAAELR